MDKQLLHPRNWSSWLIIGLLRLLALLPHAWLISLGRYSGHALYYLLSGRRHVVEVNADLCFPDLNAEEKKQFVKDVFASSIIGFFETFYSWWASDAALQGIADYEGLELIEQHHQAGRGILVIGAHFTTLDLAGRLIRLKIDPDVSYRRQNNAVFDYCIYKYRSKRFTNVVEKSEMRRLVRLLRDGRIMWLASDQDFGRQNSVFAPFFGQPTATLNSVSRIIKLTGAKPLLFVHYRFTDAHGKTRYRLRFSDPFGEQLGDDDLFNATLINKAIEDAVRVAPEQYMWVHRRFKTRENPDAPKLYQFKHKKKKRKHQ